MPALLGYVAAEFGKPDRTSHISKIVLSILKFGGAIGALIRERPYRSYPVRWTKASLIAPSCPLHQSTHSLPTLLLPTILLACYAVVNAGSHWNRK